jgi:hypothetical protein
MTSTCVVFLSNQLYLGKFVMTALSLRNQGHYEGDICLVIGDDLHNHPVLTDPILQYLRVEIKYFPDIPIPDATKDLMKGLERGPHWFPKLFQYHKFHLFNLYFKKWRRILYLDCGLTIFDSIQPLLDVWQENTLLAHSDAYPYYEWKLRDQFVKLSPYTEELQRSFDLSGDYPQTTVMLYDTNILEEKTERDLIDCMLKYPNSMTNDQGIVALYFTQIRPLWKQIPTGNDTTNFYDYLNRRNGKPYMILKIVD